MDFSGRSFSLDGLPGSFYKVVEDDKHQVHYLKVLTSLSYAWHCIDHDHSCAWVLSLPAD